MSSIEKFDTFIFTIYYYISKIKKTKFQPIFKNGKQINIFSIDEDQIKVLGTPSYINLMKIAINHSDALIVGSESIPKDLETYLKESKKPVLEYKYKDEFGEAYTEFLNSKVLS